MRRERDEDFRRYVVSRSAGLIHLASSGPATDHVVETRLLGVLARTYLTWDGPIDPELLDGHVLAAVRAGLAAPDPANAGMAEDGQEAAAGDEQVVGAVAEPDRPPHDPRRFSDRVLAEGRRLRRRRSQRAGGGIVAVVLLLAGIPVAQGLKEAAVGSPVSTAEQTRRALVSEDRAPSPSPSARPKRPLVDSERRDQDALLRDWVARLPRRVSPPGVADASSLLRVAQSTSPSGAEGTAAVAQVRTAVGRWADIVRGDVSWPGRLDSSGRWLAFTVREADRSHAASRTTVFVVRTDSGTVRARHRVVFGSTLIGWFGDRLVIQRPDEAGSLVLIDGHGTSTQRSLGPDVIPRERGGDAAFAIRAGLSGCVTALQLGLGPWGKTGRCPDDELLALSADGRIGVTRDLRWLDLRHGREAPLGRRPDGSLADRVEFVGRDRVLISLSVAGAELGVSCRLDDSCAQVSRP